MGGTRAGEDRGGREAARSIASPGADRPEGIRTGLRGGHHARERCGTGTVPGSAAGLEVPGAGSGSDPTEALARTVGHGEGECPEPVGGAGQRERTARVGVDHGAGRSSRGASGRLGGGPLLPDRRPSAVRSTRAGDAPAGKGAGSVQPGAHHRSVRSDQQLLRGRCRHLAIRRQCRRRARGAGLEPGRPRAVAVRPAALCVGVSTQRKSDPTAR